MKKSAPIALPAKAETEALLAFAEAKGRKWKDELSMVYWYNARLWTGPKGDDQAIGSVLHGIRNHPSFGPSWLLDPRVTVLALSVHLAVLNKGAA